MRTIPGLVPLVASFTLLGVATAQAQAPSDPAPVDPAADPVPPPPPAGGPPGGAVAPMPVAPPVQPAIHPDVDKGVIEDANSGRAWLMPTALSAPKGTWSFSDFELFLVSASYAVTDQFSIGATTLIPISSDVPFWALFSAKMQVARSGSLRLAVHGAATLVTGDGEGFSAAELGGAATLCLDTHCHSHVSGFVGAGFALTESNNAVPLLIGGALAARLGKRVKFVAEVDTGYIAGGGINETADGFLLWYGLRFTSRNIGVDVGFMKPIFGGTDSDDDIFPIGFPIVSFTYRGLAGD